MLCGWDGGHGGGEPPKREGLYVYGWLIHFPIEQKLNQHYKATTLPTKVRLVKAMVFPVVMYGCESWTIKKAEHQRIDVFELWC